MVGEIPESLVEIVCEARKLLFQSMAVKLGQLPRNFIPRAFLPLSLELEVVTHWKRMPFWVEKLDQEPSGICLMVMFA